MDGHASHESAAGLTTAWWCDRRARSLIACGFLLAASGIAHLVIWAVSGGPWEGPVTWRKPILFGISAGLTALSLGWVWAALPRRRGDLLLADLTAWCLVVEVALIDLQAWRGVASHFNRSTPFDSFLYDAMGVLILVVTGVTVDLAIRLFRQPARLDQALLLAARAGMVFLAVSCGLGIWVSVHGDLRMAQALPPEIVGTAGVAKFPHGAALHAIQWLPGLAWLAGLVGLGLAWRRRLVTAATAGTALLLAYALAQTLAGRSRFDASPSTAVVLAIGTVLVVLPWLVAVASRATGARR